MYIYIYIYKYIYIYIYVCVCYINILYNCKLDGVIINGTPLRPEESWSLVSWEAASWYSSSWTVSWDVKRNQQYEIYQCHQRWQLNMEVKFHDLHQKNMVILFTATIFTWFSHAFPMVYLEHAEMDGFLLGKHRSPENLEGFCPRQSPTSGIWLVVDLPLRKMMEWKSVGMMKFPTEWNNEIHVPNHQPDMYSY